MALRGVLGLPAPFLGAALQGFELLLQVLKEGGVGALMEALKLVGVGLEVVELLLPVVVLDVLVGIGPYRLEVSSLAASPALWYTISTGLVFALAFPFSLAAVRGFIYEVETGQLREVA